MFVLLLLGVLLVFIFGIRYFSPNKISEARKSFVFKFILWFWQVAPPLLLLPLATMPPNIGTSILWFIGALFASGSIANLFKHSLEAVFSKTQAERVLLIRPILTVTIFALCIVSISISQSRAIAFAKTTAEGIQTQIDDGGCPATLNGWENESDDEDRFVATTLVRTIATYQITYVADRHCESFAIWVHIDIDTDHEFRGGKNKVLSENRAYS